MHEGGVDTTDPGHDGDTGEDASGTNGGTAGIDRSNGMGVAEETPAHDAESAQRREVEVPVECVMCVGDSGGETIRRHEGDRDAEGSGGANGDEQRVRREAQGAEDDEGAKAREGDEDVALQHAEGSSGPIGGIKKRGHRGRSKESKAERRKPNRYGNKAT